MGGSIIGWLAGCLKKNAFFGFFLKKSGKKIKNRKIEDDQLLAWDNTLLLIRYHSKKSVKNPRRSINLKKIFFEKKYFFEKSIFL